MKKILLFFLLVLPALQSIRAQETMPIQREITREGDDVFTLKYRFSGDSVKGFFSVDETLEGDIKMLKTNCRLPYRFKDGALAFSGEKIIPGSEAVFTFRIKGKTVKISGVMNAENYTGKPFTHAFEEIQLEKKEAEVIAVVQEVHDPVKTDVKNPEEKKEQPAFSSETAKTSPVTFRVQLAASTSPMDRQKLRRLSGLNIEVREERIDGYYKYTVGDEVSLGSAQRLLGQIPAANFKKPFIVAYRQNTRITVQQALSEINHNR